MRSFLPPFPVGSDILGHPMIVEPSHQQRLSSRYELYVMSGFLKVFLAV